LIEPSIPDYDKGYVEALAQEYYQGFIRPSIPDQCKGCVEASAQGYYKGLIGPPYQSIIRAD
jgi:hypothetical protein